MLTYCLAIFIGIIYFFHWYKSRYWIRLGIQQYRSDILFGNLECIVFKRKSFTKFITDVYNQCTGRYIGFYFFTKSFLMIKDVELIKELFITNFDKVTDRSTFATEYTDPIWSQNLLCQKGESWKQMRATLSKTFTGIKMRNMFNLINECALKFTDFFERETEMKVVELKDVYGRFAINVIGSIAFGISIDSLNNPDDPLYTLGSKASSFQGFLRLLIFTTHSLAPSFFKNFYISVQPRNSADFFRNIVKKSIEDRKNENFIRYDLIHLLLESNKGKLTFDENNDTNSGFSVVEESELSRNVKNSKKYFSLNDITGQAFSFFAAGYETISTTLVLLSYEITINPYIQLRLQNEIDEVFIKNSGIFTYESITSMKYLDMVLSETMRKYPIGAVERKCIKPFTITPKLPNEKSLKINKGDVLWVPISGLHWDPKYYENPDVFDPERFNEENKKKIKACTYLPFGIGPRACVASRFGVIEIKILIANLLAKFTLFRIDKTLVPLKLENSFFPEIPGGMWIGLKPRKVNRLI